MFKRRSVPARAKNLYSNVRFSLHVWLTLKVFTPMKIQYARGKIILNIEGESLPLGLSRQRLRHNPFS